MSFAYRRTQDRAPEQAPTTVEPGTSVPGRAASAPPTAEERYAAAGNQERSALAEGGRAPNHTAAPRPPTNGVRGASLARLQGAEAGARQESQDPDHLAAAMPLLEQVFLDAAAAVERELEAHNAGTNWLAELLGGNREIADGARADFTDEIARWHALALEARQQASMLDAARTLASQAIVESDVTRAYLEAEGYLEVGAEGVTLDEDRLEADLGVVADGFARRNLTYAGASLDRQVSDDLLAAHEHLGTESLGLCAALAALRAQAQDAKARAAGADLARVEEVIAFVDRAGTIVDLVGTAAAGYRAVLGAPVGEVGRTALGGAWSTADSAKDLGGADSSLGVITEVGYAVEIARLQARLDGMLTTRDDLLDLAAGHDLRLRLARFADSAAGFDDAREQALAGASSEAGDLCNLAATMDDFDRLSGRLGAGRERAVPAMLHLARVRAAHRALAVVAGPLERRGLGLADFVARVESHCGSDRCRRPLDAIREDVGRRTIGGGFFGSLQNLMAFDLDRVTSRREELAGVAGRFDELLASRAV